MNETEKLDPVNQNSKINKGMECQERQQKDELSGYEFTPDKFKLVKQFDKDFKMCVQYAQRNN